MAVAEWLQTWKGTWKGCQCIKGKPHQNRLKWYLFVDILTYVWDLWLFKGVKFWYNVFFEIAYLINQVTSHLLRSWCWISLTGLKTRAITSIVTLISVVSQQLRHFQRQSANLPSVAKRIILDLFVRLTGMLGCELDSIMPKIEPSTIFATQDQ